MGPTYVTSKPQRMVLTAFEEKREDLMEATSRKDFREILNLKGKDLREILKRAILKLDPKDLREILNLANPEDFRKILEKEILTLDGKDLSEILKSAILNLDPKDLRELLNLGPKNLREILNLAGRKDVADSKDVVGPKDIAYIQYLPLYRAIHMGNWENGETFLAEKPEALTASLTANRNKPLHVAVLAGNVDIVAQLVSRLDKKDMEPKNKDGTTALIFAAAVGITEIAKLLIKKNPKLITIANKDKQIPVVVASLYGHKEMVKYLYDKTPKDELSPEKGKNGTTLLTSCIMGDMFDVALDLLQHHRRLAVTKDIDGDTAPDMLAQKPSAFLSGSTLGFWQHWIYSYTSVPSHQCLRNTNGDIEMLHNVSTIRRNMITEGLHKLVGTLGKHLRNFVPAIKYIYDLKLSHAQAKELLCCICDVISTYPLEDFDKIGAYRAIFNAVDHGIVEFIEEIIKQYPDILWIGNNKGQSILLYAVECRQEKVFNLIYHMDAQKGLLAAVWDKDENNILHKAALRAPTHQLDRVTGAALQMQRELQWFKEVDNIVQPKFRGMVNREGKRALRALFSEEHKDLKEAGEKWIKKIAESSTLVAALITTIMFSVAFTVPGGNNDQTGDPNYLDRNSYNFIVFVISDAVSLFASSTSLLIFLGIVSARYVEEDFLVSLPATLIAGLSMLFFSIVTMMVTFGASLVMMLRQRVSWFSFPIILLGGLPVIIFAMQQFPLLVEIVRSTYGPGIFDKPKKRWSFMSRKTRSS